MFNMKRSVKRKRKEHRYKVKEQTRKANDLRIANLHAGRILSKEKVLRTFGYSPKTYIHDTTIMRQGLIKRVGKDKYKIVGQNDERD